MKTVAPIAVRLTKTPKGRTGTETLPLFGAREDEDHLAWGPGAKALEDDTFPFEALSDIAEVESWRKEINRPLSHIHKWWAQRLGTVFRAVILGAFAPSGTDLLDLFYKPIRFPKALVFDPFMGSGTTVGEALKLGARAVGRDINPVAHFLVRNALAVHDHAAILRTFVEIENSVADRIRHFYRTILPDGRDAEVLYFFWVKQLDCPACTKPVDLFSSRIFAQHAYPKRFPKAQAICPHCDAVNEVTYDAFKATCSKCETEYDPQIGPAHGQAAHCPHCDHSFSIAKRARESSQPPRHRLYAKLVLMPDGGKTYQPVIESDRELYEEASRALGKRIDAFPVVPIEPGHNTNQALGYNYRYWHQMFNDRQLLSLSILSERIGQINDPVIRELFACLLSGTLEFNNMFASYKGEGTGAVRHMFAHHILKPERMPLEANIWGTPKSSGAFTTLFDGRIRRALNYAGDPFELRIGSKKGRAVNEKVFGLSEPLGFPIAETFHGLATGTRAYLSCGDSSITDLPDQSVDAVITDPPFFDNVHYSQLADFFHVWQRHILGRDGHREICTTRSSAEVQHSDPVAFTSRLGAVFVETHRVLKDEGLLAFTYHHSRPDGWRCVLEAIMRAGYTITAVHPIKAEMSVAMPKQQAKEPIDLDIIMVCRKRSQLKPDKLDGDLWASVAVPAEKQINRFYRVGRRLSRNDVRVIVTAQLLRRLSSLQAVEAALFLLDANRSEIETRIETVYLKREEPEIHVKSEFNL